MIAWLLMAVSHAGAWILAAALQRRLPTGSRAGDLCGALVLHALVASLCVLAAGSVGALSLAGLTVAGVASGVAGTALGGVGALRDAARAAKAIVRDAERESRALAVVVALLAAALAIRHLANAWLFVPYTVDEHAYHLPKLVAWMQTGTLDRPEILDGRSWFPAGMQVLQAWWTGFLRHDVLIEGASLEFAALAAAATAAIARSAGASRGGAAFAGLLFSCAPLALAQATSALNDLAAGACVLAACALLARPARFRDSLALAAVAIAVGAGIKPTALFAAPAPLLLGVLARRRRLPSESSPIAPIAVCALAAVVGASWYAANWGTKGSPVYPVSPGFSGPSVVGPANATAASGPSFRALGKNLASVFGPRYLKFDALVTPVAHELTGWGPALALAGPLALGFLLWREPRIRAPAAAVALGTLVTLLLSAHDPFNSRFVLWAAALPAAALGASMTAHRLAWAAAAVLALAAGSDLVRTCVPPVLRNDSILQRFVARGWRERDARQLVLLTMLAAPGAQADQEIAQRLYDREDPLLVLAPGFPIAALARGDYRRRLEFGEFGSGEEVVRVLDSRAVELIFARKPPPREAEALRQAQESGDVREWRPAWYVRVKR